MQKKARGTIRTRGYLMMKRWWMGGLVTVIAGALVMWAWQGAQERQRLARELASAHTMLARVKADQASLQAQLTQVRTDLEQTQGQRDEFASQLKAADDRVAAAEAAQRQAETALGALQAQEQVLRTEKTLLEGRIAVLQHEKETLQPRGASSPARGSSSSRMIPPTAGPSSDTGAGNRGYLMRNQATDEPRASQRVNVWPDPNDASTFEAPR